MALGASFSGVPFALVAGVQLLAVAASLTLAGAACYPRLRRRTTPLFVIGAFVVAVAEALTATTYGHPASTSLAVLRAVGLGLMAIGLATGVLHAPGGGGPWLPTATTGSVGVGAVVVPLGASVGAATATAVAGGLAALAALRLRRDDELGAALLSAGFVFLAVAGALGTAATSSRGAALALLASRGCAALLLFADVIRLARSSVLAKVVAAMLAGVLLMAIGAVGVGSVVTNAVGKQQANQTRRVALSQLQALDQLRLQAGQFAGVVAVCPAIPKQCVELLQRFGALPGSFAAVIPAGGGPVDQFVPAGNRLSAAAVLQLRSEPVVRAVFASHPASREGASTLAVLDGELTILGVVPAGAPSAPNTKPTAVAVYGGRINNGFASQQQTATTYAVTVLIGDRAVASSLSEHEAQVVARVARAAGVTSGALAETNVVVRSARASEPTVAFAELNASDGTPLGVLAVSQSARVALAAERRASTELFVTALVVMIVVSLVAVGVGHRIVEPVRRLTVVANRVRRGDLSATAGEAGTDEVGTLARAFDAMTSSVARLTDDLRAAATEEAALRTRLETVLDSMSDGLVATDANGRVTSINPAGCALAGVQPEDAIGRSLPEVLNLRDNAGAPVADLNGNRTQADAELLRQGGGAVPVQVAVAPLEGSGGVVVVVRDQSRERDLERMKTQFLANVSHELRTPLTPIKGYAELLRRQPDLTRRTAAGYVDTILDSASRMSRVVDLLVDVAAIEAGRVRAEARPVQVDTFLPELLETWRKRYPARADDLRRRVARGLPDVVVDPVWLGKALDEFVDNAAKHTPRGTTITIGAMTAGPGMVRFYVRDNGPGIDVAATPGLFADFVQVDGSATRSVGGLGLGLAFVRRIAQEFGLGVAVRSAPGRGSEFTLDVPTAKPGRSSRAGSRRTRAGTTPSD